MNYGPPGGGYGGPPPGGGGYGGPPGGGGGGYGGPPGGGGGYGGPPAGGGGFGPPPPPGGMGGGYGGQPPMGPMMGSPSTGMAIAALVCGILAIPGACCCYSSIPLGIAACIMGPIAMGKAKNSPMTHGGRNMALAGLICGIVGLVLTIFAVIFHVSTAVMDQVQHH